METLESTNDYWAQKFKLVLLAIAMNLLGCVEPNQKWWETGSPKSILNFHNPDCPQTWIHFHKLWDGDNDDLMPSKENPKWFTIPRERVPRVTEQDTTTTKKDTTTINQQWDSLSNDLHQKYQQQIAIKPTSVDSVSDNPEVLWRQIDLFAQDSETLMIIAQSASCTTALLTKIAKTLNANEILTNQVKSLLKRLFDQRLDYENEVNEFNPKIDQILSLSKAEQFNAAIQK